MSESNPVYHEFDQLVNMGLTPYYLEDDLDGGYNLTELDPNKMKVPAVQTSKTYYYVVENNTIVQVLAKDEVVWKEAR